MVTDSDEESDERTVSGSRQQVDPSGGDASETGSDWSREE